MSFISTEVRHDQYKFVVQRLLTTNFFISCRKHEKISMVPFTQLVCYYSSVILASSSWSDVSHNDVIIFEWRRCIIICDVMNTIIEWRHQRVIDIITIITSSQLSWKRSSSLLWPHYYYHRMMSYHSHKVPSSIPLWHDVITMNIKWRHELRNWVTSLPIYHKNHRHTHRVTWSPS